ncbi:unnamed protein product [Urochloa humidicola]
MAPSPVTAAGAAPPMATSPAPTDHSGGLRARRQSLVAQRSFSYELKADASKPAAQPSRRMSSSSSSRAQARWPPGRSAPTSSDRAGASHRRPCVMTSRATSLAAPTSLAATHLATTTPNCCLGCPVLQCRPCCLGRRRPIQLCHSRGVTAIEN